MITDETRSDSGFRDGVSVIVTLDREYIELNPAAISAGGKGLDW